MRLSYTFFFFFLLVKIGFSQNERLYTMFVFNKLQYNPAYAGAKDALNIGVHYRHQWQGVEGAPKTISAFAHTPFGDGRSGLGLTLTSDEIGILNTTIGSVDYAYRIQFKNKHRLSVGLNLQLDNASFNWSKANLLDNSDKNIPLDAATQTTMNIGVGVYYSSAEEFYVGISAPGIMRNAITSNSYHGFSRYNEFRPYYLMGGLILKAGDNILLRPSFLISYIANAPFEVDVNLSVLLMEKFWIGANYRLQESIDAYVQFPITEQLKLAVGYDYPVTKLNQFTSGSGEIMLEYIFNKGTERVNNIRYF